jgi:hypothetical protein
MWSDVLGYADVLFSSVREYLNAFVIALVILLSGFILARIADRLSFKLFVAVSFDDFCYSIFRRRRNYARATRGTIVNIMYLVTLYFALQQLRVERVALLFAVGLLAFIVLVSLVLAAAETLPNVVSRFRLRNIGIRKGDTIIIHDVAGKLKGKVTAIRLIEVELKRNDGDVFFYPNVGLLRTRVTKR